MIKVIISLCFSLICIYQGYAVDKGIGILSLKEGKNQLLNIYSKKELKSEVLAKYSVDISKGWADYSISGDGMKVDNLVEYGYEKSGLPICEIESNDWIEVIYGYDESNKLLSGWVKANKDKIETYLWRSYLKDQLIFFEDPNQVKFFDSIEGEEINFQLDSSEHLTYDYIMKPQAVEGNWMKVEVVSPSDYCNDPDNARRKTVWIKFLNENGRPLVWYFTRGC